MKSICTVSVLALTLLFPAVCPAAAYTVIDLGTLGGDFSEGNAVNDTGQVVGTSRVNNSFPYQHATLFENGNQIDLQTLGGNFSQAFDINNSGQIVGYATIAAGGLSKPTLWQNGVPQDIAPAAFIGQAKGINDAGQVVGYTAGDQTRAFLWTADNGLTYIGTLGGNASAALDINASGQIVGSSFATQNGPSHAFYYDGTMHDLGTLPGYDSSEAAAINDSGLIVGHSEVGVNNRAFFYDGTMHDLGTLGGNYSRALDINNSDTVVGVSRDGNNAYRAFIWDGSGPLIDLNALIDPLSGWTLQSAHGINDAGYITGNGWVGTPANQELHAFLLVPVPEPSSILLAALALVALFILRARKG